MTRARLKIALVDYGLGNLYSILRAMRCFGVDVVVTEEAEEIEKADGILLPGVGAFAAGMKGLELRGLAGVIKKAAQQNRPMLGICLGAQLMLTEGHEFGEHLGLDIIKGKVVQFPSLKKPEKIPHVGWNSILTPSAAVSWRGTIFDELDERDRVYFVHSYIMKPDKETDVLAVTSYGDYQFCSAVRKGNIYGCQFHPEKSGQVGLKIISEFVKIIAKH